MIGGVAGLGHYFGLAVGSVLILLVLLDLELEF
jgi:phage shock protein PspC (stress-responsive transcriptional regulator)